MRYYGGGHSGCRLKNDYQNQTPLTSLWKFLFSGKLHPIPLSVIYSSRWHKEQCSLHGLTSPFSCFSPPLQNQGVHKEKFWTAPIPCLAPRYHCLYYSNIVLGYILQNKTRAEGNDCERPHMPHHWDTQPCPGYNFPVQTASRWKLKATSNSSPTFYLVCQYLLQSSK